MKNKKYDNEQTISDALSLMMSRYKMESRITETKVEMLWYEIMGKGVASYTDKVLVKNKVMHVYLTSAELRNELSYGRSKIVKMINEQLHEQYLKEIKFC